MLKRLLGWLMYHWMATTQQINFVEEGIKQSWSEVLQEKGTLDKVGKLIFYSKAECPVCKEIKLWLDFNWIPHIYLECKHPFVSEIPKIKSLIHLRGFKVKDKKNKIKETIFLPQYFPQLEFVYYSEEHKAYLTARQVGHSQLIRNFVTHIVEAYPKAFPGFERGIYGDKTPEEILMNQMKNAGGQANGKDDKSV